VALLLESLFQSIPVIVVVEWHPSLSREHSGKSSRRLVNGRVGGGFNAGNKYATGGFESLDRFVVVVVVVF